MCLHITIRVYINIKISRFWHYKYAFGIFQGRPFYMPDWINASFRLAVISNKVRYLKGSMLLIIL